MPQGQPQRAKAVFQCGAEDPGLDAGRAADRVDFEHRVETTQVHRHGGPVETRFDPADHGTAAAVRNQRDSLDRTPVEQVDDVLFGSRTGDQIRKVVHLPEQIADDVAEGLAAGVGQPIDGFVAAQRGQRRGRTDP